MFQSKQEHRKKAEVLVFLIKCMLMHFCCHTQLYDCGEPLYSDILNYLYFMVHLYCKGVFEEFKSILNTEASSF